MAATWPPSADVLEALVFDVLGPILQDSAAGSKQAAAFVPGQALSWRRLGLDSSQGVRFMTALSRELRVRWPAQADVMPELTGTLMFSHGTTSKLIAFLEKTLGSLPTSDAAAQEERSGTPKAAADENRVQAAKHTSEEGAVNLAVGHVVSVGTICMSVNMMEMCDLRRWPGPFDWVFSTPAMALHCLRDNFATFLDPSKYFSAPSGKAGHSIYSPMLEREVIFNHHNPMVSHEYSFLSQCTDHFMGLFKSWPLNAEEALSQASPDKQALFLLFNLEKRGPLVDDDVLGLFAQMRAQCLLPFELLVVKVRTNCEDKKPTHRTLVQEERRGAGGEGLQPCMLSVHELRCVGGHDGLRFSNADDAAVLKAVLLGEASEATIDGSLPMKRTFALSEQSPAATRKSPSGANGYNGKVESAGVALTSKLPVQDFLGRAQELHERHPGALRLHRPQLLKFLRRLGIRDEGAPGEGAAQAVVDSGTGGYDQVWKPLQKALQCTPVFLSQCDRLRIWAPAASKVLPALEVLRSWTTPEAVDSQLVCALLVLKDGLPDYVEPCSSIERADAGQQQEPAARHLLEPAAATSEVGLQIEYEFKTNSDLFRMYEPPANIPVKGLRTQARYAVVTRRLGKTPTT
eukprot:TRINITY_DN13086_c0_g1_i1.p1 TRINITY_DN13086_c0_g1~~TRINITY_DN13086_c0_g1_i1.p1  ORF type:complete len:631 (+),score=120.94 TRINITY_DN13086_c0_g1_i1:157-2049(+)